MAGLAPLSLASLAPQWKIINLIIANLSIEGKRIILGVLMEGGGWLGLDAFSA
ncbi:hypothetical protein GCWU000182_01798 [Abiotrophia defectiva ATCC 49176]|uniref:Uncharacterized protein n=1 Tax=Abiotrophia defectiva ATCC 49176 TaxID=592010 RepID=W1Q1I7_ABIDE|nr:hypothetical protein GCWU000182_01798 [Abiotrophia defectiva ATCC 49176]